MTPLALPIESMRVPSFGEGKCKRDLGIIVDAIIGDMRSGGNSNILDATERYIDGTALLTNGIAGELAESTTAFNKARDMAKLAITNQLYNKDLLFSQISHNIRNLIPPMLLVLFIQKVNMNMIILQHSMRNQKKVLHFILSSLNLLIVLMMQDILINLKIFFLMAQVRSMIFSGKMEQTL